MSSWPPLPFPNEILEKIFVDTWNATRDGTPKERAALYRSISDADPRLRQVIVHVALRNVILEWHREHLQDFELYDSIAGDAASLAGVHEDTGRAPALRALFRSSHVRLSFDPFGLLQRKSGDYIASKKAFAWSAPAMDALGRLFHSCRSFTLTHSRERKVLPERTLDPLFRVLHGFLALESLHIDCYFTDDELWCPESEPDAIPTLPTVRFLRLKHFPLCACACTAEDPAPAPRRRWPTTRRKACLGGAFRVIFPSLQHLHLENAVFLKRLVRLLPRTLTTLTLDAPLTRPIAARPPYSSLLDYNVAAALRRGLLRPARHDGTGGNDGDGAARTIIVHAGTADPYGWTAARAACGEAGVRLVKVVSYLAPVERTDFEYVKSKKVGQARLRPFGAH